MRIEKNFNLTFFNSYRIQAFCSRVFFPENEKDIHEIFINFPNNKKIIIGGGNNVIFSKEWYDNDFIILRDNFGKFEFYNNLLVAEAGASMQVLSEQSLNNSLSGLELFYDIPSTIGGAVVMNAGAVGEDIEQIVSKVRVYDTSTNLFREFKRAEIDFGYRYSMFQMNANYIVTKVWLTLKHSTQIAIKEKMELNKRTRWEKQPREFPNCGSVFKRPPGKFVGPMIEELGLKGFTVGGAQVSEKHAGFIINKGNATGAEIIQLINIIKTKVLEKFGVELEIEQKIF
jgi:UDP-N-acetylmuramate dehydrogenase